VEDSIFSDLGLATDFKLEMTPFSTWGLLGFSVLTVRSGGTLLLDLVGRVGGLLEARRARFWKSFETSLV